MDLYTYNTPTFLLNPCFLVELKTSHMWWCLSNGKMGLRNSCYYFAGRDGICGWDCCNHSSGEGEEERLHEVIDFDRHF